MNTYLISYIVKSGYSNAIYQCEKLNEDTIKNMQRELGAIIINIIKLEK